MTLFSFLKITYLREYLRYWQETRAENRRGSEVCKKLLTGDRKPSKLQLRIAVSSG
ncbi:unnamed protein product [Bubo scandiacus]